MVASATPRFKIPYPSDGLPGWWQLFSDMAVAFDAALFGAIEANAWTLGAVPTGHVDALGGGAYALVLDGPLTLVSRTLQTDVTVPAGSTALLAGHLITVTVPAGATTTTAAALTLVQNAVTIDPTVRVLGVVNADFSITWWNAHRTTPGVVRQLFGGDAVVGATEWQYWGSPAVDGSWRIGQFSGDLVVQKRIATVWTTSHTFT